MGRYVQGKDGKFAGSIGDGKTSIPTVSEVPRSGSVPVGFPEPDATVESAWAAYQQRADHYPEERTFADPVGAVSFALASWKAAQKDGHAAGWTYSTLSGGPDGSAKDLHVDRSPMGRLAIRSLSERTDTGRRVFPPHEVQFEFERPESSSYAKRTTVLRLDEDGALHAPGDRSRPSVEAPTGFQWHRHGQLHRVSGPAVMTTDRREWHRHGRLLATLDESDGVLRTPDGQEATRVRGWWLRRRCAGWNRRNPFAPFDGSTT